VAGDRNRRLQESLVTEEAGGRSSCDRSGWWQKWLGDRNRRLQESRVTEEAGGRSSCDRSGWWLELANGKSGWR
jgi:hypothetical protein